MKILLFYINLSERGSVLSVSLFRSKKGYSMKSYFNFVTKSICMVLFLGITSIISATNINRENYANRKEFATTDQKIGYFRGFGKPWMTVFKPAQGQLSMVTFGKINTETGSIEQFKNYGTEFETLIPIRFTIKFVETPVSVQIDKIYAGWRESYIGRALETIFKSIKFLPDLKYQGTPFVDEYQECMPMKWVFNDMQDFVGFKTYLKKKFEEKNVQPLAEKPLLLIEFDKINQTFEKDDLSFLTTYYELLDATDPIVKKFFDTKQETVDEARDNTKDAKVILDSYGEMFMRTIEGAAWDFKGKEMIIYGTAAVALALTVDLVKDYVKAKVTQPVRVAVVGK